MNTKLERVKRKVQAKLDALKAVKHQNDYVDGGMLALEYVLEVIAAAEKESGLL